MGRSSGRRWEAENAYAAPTAVLQTNCGCRQLALRTARAATMTKKAQKLKELFFLDQFIAETKRWQLVKVGEPPEPDFFVSDSRGVLGVELTSIQNDAAPGESSRATAIESQREQFMRRAAHHYYQKGGLPIQANAVQLPPTGIDLEILTIRLLESRERAMANHDKADEFEITPNDNPDELPLAKFRVLALDPEKFPRYSWWQAWENSLGCVLRASVEYLKPVVQRKAANLAAYRKSVARVALLIYSERTKASGMIQLPPDARLADSHGFDEIHVFMPPVQVLQLV